MARPVLTSNDPAPGHISWTGFNIAYDGAGYSVSAGSTDKAYVWWQYNAGSPVLMAADALPEEMSPDDLLLFLNKDGAAIDAQKSSFVDGSLLIDGTVAADALAVGAVTADKIAAESITGEHLKIGTITADRIVTDELVVGGNLLNFEEGYDPSEKNQTHYEPSTDPPPGKTAGDLWYVTDQGNILKRWDGWEWIDVPISAGSIEYRSRDLLTNGNFEQGWTWSDDYIVSAGNYVTFGVETTDPITGTQSGKITTTSQYAKIAVYTNVWGTRIGGFKAGQKISVYGKVRASTDLQSYAVMAWLSPSSGPILGSTDPWDPAFTRIEIGRISAGEASYSETVTIPEGFDGGNMWIGVSQVDGSTWPEGVTGAFEIVLDDFQANENRMPEGVIPREALAPGVLPSPVRDISVNGDAERVTGGTPTGWSIRPLVEGIILPTISAETSAPLSGRTSVKLSSPHEDTTFYLDSAKTPVEGSRVYRVSAKLRFSRDLPSSAYAVQAQFWKGEEPYEEDFWADVGVSPLFGAAIPEGTVEHVGIVRSPKEATHLTLSVYYLNGNVPYDGSAQTGDPFDMWADDFLIGSGGVLDDLEGERIRPESVVTAKEFRTSAGGTRAELTGDVAGYTAGVNLYSNVPKEEGPGGINVISVDNGETVYTSLDGVDVGNFDALKPQVNLKSKTSLPSEVEIIGDRIEFIANEVVIPKVKAHLQRQNAQNCAHNKDTTIRWDTLYADTGNFFDESSVNGDILIPETGFYRFIVRGSLDVANKDAHLFQVHARLKGGPIVAVFARQAAGSPYAPQIGTAVSDLYLQGGDVVNIQQFHNTGATAPTFEGGYCPEVIVEKQ